MVTTDPSPVGRRRVVRAGLSGAGLWVLIEFATRTGLGWAVLRLARLVGSRPGLGEIYLLSNALKWPAVIVLGIVFYRRVRREGLTWAELGYRSGRSAVAAGLIAGVIWLGLGVVSYIDAYLFGKGDVERYNQAALAAGPVAELIMLPVNGILAPVVEELAWRGYVQTHLVWGWGPRTGIVVTSLLFAAKHNLVDLSLSRSISLLVGALVLGIVGYRWGTVASTIAHVVVNFTSTLALLLNVYFTLYHV